MTIRMRAAVLREIGLPAPYEQSRPLSIEEVELDGPGAGEILVRIPPAPPSPLPVPSSGILRTRLSAGFSLSFRPNTTDSVR